MKRWEVFVCKRLPVLLGILFLLCGARESFAVKLKLGLYDGDKTTTTQFSATQSTYPWFTETTAKELVHMKLGIKTDTGSVGISSFQVTITFDKDYFEVADSNGTKVTSITGISPYFAVATGNPCVDVLNTVDYTTGTIKFVAWVPAQGLCYASGASALTASSSAPAMVMDFYLKPLKGSNGVEKPIKIDDTSDNTFVNDTNDVTYSKDDSSLLLETNHGTTGYKFKIKPLPPTLAAPVATNTKITLTWTGNDATATKYNVYRGKTTTSGAAEPTSFTKLTTQDLTVLTYDDSTIKWDGQFTKYWYKVVAKDTAATAQESCASPSYAQCAAKSVTDLNVPVVASFDASSTVFDKAQVSATLDEPGYIKANYSCPTCATPVNNQDTAYGSFSNAGKPAAALPAFASADEGKTVTFKVKAKDAAGNEMTDYTAEKTFTITTCKETAKPTLTTPASSISCPSSVVVTWDTGANASDSTIYYSKTQFADLKAEFVKGTSGVFKCNDPSLVKSPTNHSLSVPECGGNPALDAGIDYFYQICSANCFDENCSASTNKFKLDVALNVTHACSTIDANSGQAFNLSATYTGGCAPVNASVKFADTADNVVANPQIEPMTDASGTFTGSVPSTFIQDPLTEFKYFIYVEDAAGTKAVKPTGADTNGTAACTVKVKTGTLCGTPAASCTNTSVPVGQAATVNLSITSGTAPYTCDLYFGASSSSVTEKINSAAKSVSADGSYQETIPAAKTATAGTYFFKSSCTDSCTDGGPKTAESSPCQLTVGGEIELSTVSGSVKAGDTNAAFEGATVKLIDTTTSNSTGVCDDADGIGADCTTGADGAFRFKEVQTTSTSGKYRVTVTATGYSSKLVDVPPVTTAGVSVGEIILDKTTKITGKCTDSKTNSGISGLKVKVVHGTTGAKSEVATDANGDFSVENLTTGTYSVDVDVAGTKYKKPATQNITVPPDGLANFSLEPSPVTTVAIAPATKSIGFNEQAAFYVDKVLTGSGASLPKTPVEWDISNISALGTVSYSDGNKTILLFKSSTTEGSGVLTVTKVGGEDVPAGSVSTATITITPTLAVKEIKLLMPVTSGTNITASNTMKKPISKDVGYVIIQSEVTQSNVSVVYKIYNMQGRLMKVLNADPVTQQANWDCTDANGARLPNGIYIVQAEASGGGQNAHAGKPKTIGCLW